MTVTLCWLVRVDPQGEHIDGTVTDSVWLGVMGFIWLLILFLFVYSKNKINTTHLERVFCEKKTTKQPEEEEEEEAPPLMGGTLTLATQYPP